MVKAHHPPGLSPASAVEVHRTQAVEAVVYRRNLPSSCRVRGSAVVGVVVVVADNLVVGHNRLAVEAEGNCLEAQVLDRG